MPKVLIIDDEASITTIIGRFLENTGFETATAASGPEGLQKAVTLRPDVVIIDIMMPEMDGYEVCRRLRNDPRTARSVIVALTARGQPIDRQMALRSGADAHITKPFKGKALAQEIQQLLNGRSCVGPPLGRQVLVLRLQEGAGTTTLVTNLSLCLAQRQGCQAVVADMMFRGGAVAERLGLPAADSWPALSQLTPGMLAPFLRKHEEGLFVLPAPSPPVKSQISPETASWLLQTLRNWSDFVLPDTPLNLGPLAPALLKSSALILLLLTPEPTVLRQAQASLSVIQNSASASAQVWPIFNMVRPEQQPVVQQVEKVWGLRVGATLPWAPQECAQALAEQKPVILTQPNSPLATAIQGLARKVARAAGAQISKRKSA